MALTTDLEAYYKLDETSGTVVEDATGNIDATNNGATVNQAGIIDKSYDFEHSGYLTTDSSFTFGTEITMSGWVYIENQVEAFAIVSKTSDDTNDLALEVYNGEPYIILGNSIFVGMGSAMSINTWHHVVGTYDGTTMKIYVDNDLKNSGTSFSGNVADSILYIGWDRGIAGRFLTGKIDEVGIWSRALNSTEVTELYNSGSGLAYPFVTDVTKVVSALTLSTTDEYPTLITTVPEAHSP